MLDQKWQNLQSPPQELEVGLRSVARVLQIYNLGTVPFVAYLFAESEESVFNIPAVQKNLHHYHSG